VVKPVVAALLIAAYVVFGLATLTAFPLVWEDEPWYAQSAWAFVDQSAFTLPMFADLAGFDEDNVVYGRTYLGAVAAAFELGGLSPYTARLVSFISGLVAITAVFGIGRELWSDKVGAIAAVFFALTPNFVQQSHDARPEIMLVAAWTAAFYFTISGDQRLSSWRLFLGGLIAALAADVHLNGLIVPVALFVVLLVRRAPPRSLLVFGGGAAVGALWWLFIHVWPDPSLLREQVGAFSVGLPIFDLSTEPHVVIALEIARYVLVEPRLSVIILALALVAAVALLLRNRDLALLSLLTFAAAFYAFMTLFSGTKVPFYAVLLLPVAALLVARLVDVSQRPAALAMSALVVVASLLSVAAVTRDLAPADYDRYIAGLREHVPAGATVQGEPTIWYGFSDHPMIATQLFLQSGRYKDEVRRLGIEYVVDDHVEPLPGCRDCIDTAQEDVRRFLAQSAELVAEVRDPHYGRVPAPDGDGFVTRVYRVTEEFDQQRPRQIPSVLASPAP
jgi:4-amino-4-deoxy-L-arabinose transferase-like glycosyltransferase